MKATTIKEAWSLANEIFPTDYMKNDEKSDRAGYDIYESTLDGSGAWISDLGSRLEINLDGGRTVNIWIEPESPVERPTEPATAHRKTETEISFESVTTHTTAGETTTTTREARLSLSADTSLKDIAHFESDARRLVKAARAASNRGDSVTVTLCKARYTYTTSDDLRQERFEMWTGYSDSITGDGVHLNPSEQYNDDPAHDMWLTGDRGEILHEITI